MHVVAPILASLACACIGRRTGITSKGLQSSAIKQSASARSDLKLLANFLVGGFSKAGLLVSKDGEHDPALDIWDQVVAKSSTHEGHDLKALGKPIIVKKQTVAGINYMFGFKSGASAVVFHQPWTSTLEISRILDDPSTNQKRLTEWSQDVEELRSLIVDKKADAHYDAARSSDALADSSLHSLLELKQSSSSGRSDLRASSRLSSSEAAVAMLLFGGWSKIALLGSRDGLHGAALDIWDEVVAKTPTHEGHDLKALGTPSVVKKQVVAGTNYMFGFESGASAVVFHQPWTRTLKVTKVEDDPKGNQARLKKWNQELRE